MYFYAVDMAYITPPATNDAPKAFRRRLYIALHTMTLAAKRAREVRAMLLQPSTTSSKVWHNLHSLDI